MNPLYVAPEYRAFVRNWLDAQSETRGLLTKMARAVGCQNSHLSRLLHREVHFTPDQAYAASEFMRLGSMETAYFLKLVERDRSSTPAFRRRLQAELDALKREQEHLAGKFQEERIAEKADERLYYSAWFWSAIHILTDIPLYQTTAAISCRLGLSESFVAGCLNNLLQMGLVYRDGSAWKIGSNSIHLPKESPMNSVQHGNWRARAVLGSQDPRTSGLHYTMVQAVSAEDYSKIKQLLLASIQSYRSIADRSESEKLVCFTCDFFEV